MKTVDFIILALFIAFLTIYSLIENRKNIQQSETRIIEAIEKHNDSINAVQFLNRDK